MNETGKNKKKAENDMKIHPSALIEAKKGPCLLLSAMASGREKQKRAAHGNENKS